MNKKTKENIIVWSITAVLWLPMICLVTMGVHVGKFEDSAAAIRSASSPVPTLWTDTNGFRWQARWERLP